MSAMNGIDMFDVSDVNFHQAECVETLHFQIGVVVTLKNLSEVLILALR